MKHKFAVHTIVQNYKSQAAVNHFDAEMERYMNDGWICAAIQHSDNSLTATMIRDTIIPDPDAEIEIVQAEDPAEEKAPALQ